MDQLKVELKGVISSYLNQANGWNISPDDVLSIREDRFGKIRVLADRGIYGHPVEYISPDDLERFMSEEYGKTEVYGENEDDEKEELPEPVVALDMSVDELPELQDKVVSLLKKSSIETVGQLIDRFDDGTLVDIDGVGPATVRGIGDSLSLLLVE